MKFRKTWIRPQSTIETSTRKMSLTSFQFTRRKASASSSWRRPKAAPIGGNTTAFDCFPVRSTRGLKNKATLPFLLPRRHRHHHLSAGGEKRRWSSSSEAWLTRRLRLWDIWVNKTTPWRITSSRPRKSSTGTRGFLPSSEMFKGTVWLDCESVRLLSILVIDSLIYSLWWLDHYTRVFISISFSASFHREQAFRVKLWTVIYET